MAQRRLSMRQVRDLLRLRFEKGMSHREIAACLLLSSSTVGECLRRAEKAGVV